MGIAGGQRPLRFFSFVIGCNTWDADKVKRKGRDRSGGDGVFNFQGHLRQTYTCIWIPRISAKPIKMRGWRSISLIFNEFAVSFKFHNILYDSCLNFPYVCPENIVFVWICRMRVVVFFVFVLLFFHMFVSCFHFFWFVVFCRTLRCVCSNFS